MGASQDMTITGAGVEKDGWGRWLICCIARGLDEDLLMIGRYGGIVMNMIIDVGSRLALPQRAHTKSWFSSPQQPAPGVPVALCLVDMQSMN